MLQLKNTLNADGVGYGFIYNLVVVWFYLFYTGMPSRQV